MSAAAPPPYIGRFAPSPTGPLHAGSLVAALASWLDARAWNAGTGGRWLVRIEDLDTTRCSAGAAATILRQLTDCQLIPDEAPLFQTRRRDRYARALAQLIGQGRAYACACSRKDIEAAWQAQGIHRSRHGERVYPGTCRNGLHGKPALSWRFRVAAQASPDAAERADSVAAPSTADRYQASTSANVYWQDRRLGAQQQDVAAEVGDFLLQRADGPFAYQLAVVVDDAAQQVSDVVRGADLADNTARQILLQQALGLATPRYLHTPLVLGHDGQKLSKQNGAQAIDTRHPLQALAAAAAVLGLPDHTGPVTDALAVWVAAWRALYNPGQ
ncbi:MAG: tRNA glutamyl-Q(34) synthetase GluQRS [Rhodoferax sp.]|nr:tRNA glutamyl-Q(34) synthetase GluQRS [Rhodoferax sp.]HQX61407.1 tRNA glutamyl-Q(34) synthetase GluQRS [Burkholderiaceae bacterium]